MMKVHETAQKYYHYQANITDSTKVAANFDRIIQIISDSVKPTVPSIIETRNL
jgi:hypothetical protein